MTSLCLLFCFIASAQKEASPNATPATDRFIGTWKLNVDKSSAAPESEILTIEPEGSKFKFACQTSYGNGTTLKYWVITDMNGGYLKLTQFDGRPMNEEWSITRKSRDAFTVDSRPPGSQVSYEVSADGQTMTARTISSAIVGGRVQNGVITRVTPTLVFDRVR
jgi:hypothetical protein